MRRRRRGVSRLAASWAAVANVVRTWVVVGACLVGAAPRLAAQVDPSVRWETLHTAHFRVHFNPQLEDQARRAAVNAERAYAALARELVPPRGIVDIVLADNVDLTNGQATPFPTNRIIIYAYPPVDAPTLRYYGDWNALVIQHELTHIFHLDRARGWWRVAQKIFGRNPVLMPNLYTPAWLTEGLAVYYESRLTGFGRLAGTAHRTLAEAAARDTVLPRLDQLSLIAPEWPNGEGPYIYGSLLFSYLSATRGAASIPAFIEHSSAAAIPFLLERTSRASFGISFEDAWRVWRDSVLRDAAVPDIHALTLTTITHEGYEAYFPRWIDSTTLIYAADNERDLPGVYAVTVAGRSRRIGRRNGTSPNAPIPTGLVYSQLDFISPYTIRSDLYRSDMGRTVQLTHGARLSDPDARADGKIIAVWGHQASTQLVLVSADGRTVTPITPYAADTEWSEPRWSPDGRRVAAVRWERGGYMAVVVVDTAGRTAQTILRERAVIASPSWTPDGRYLVFTSDRTGRAEVYRVGVGAELSRAHGAVALIGGGGAGLSYPALSPDGSRLAVTELRGDGYHIGVTRFDPTRGYPVAGGLVHRDSAVVPPLARDSGRITRYTPWAGLIPRYWMPVANTSDQGYFQLGAYTSAFDVLQRHSYELQALYDFREPAQVELTASYEYRGLGFPVLDAGGAEYWTHQPIANANGQSVGELVHRTVTASLAETLLWPRARTNASWSVGADLEARTYSTTPGPLIDAIDPFYASHPYFPSVFTTIGWSNAQRPALSISPENGISFATTLRQRWQQAASAATERSIVGVADLYRALDFPGFAHHVVAAKFALGLENDGAISTFTAGGRSGEVVTIVPGVSVGDEPRVFGVRGFPPGAANGTRAMAGSLEYRLPLFAPGRGLHLLPFFLGKTSLTVFGDGGEAWCPVHGGTVPGVCDAQDAQRRLLSSAGAELNFDTSLQYDVPYRLRLGMAVPTSNGAFYGASPVDFYVTFGLPF
jgi:Tol biopolymer transport system component